MYEEPEWRNESRKLAYLKYGASEATIVVAADQGPCELNWKQGGVCLRDIARPSHARFNTEYSLV